MAQHPLLRKRGMDAANQELLQETDYPAADKDWNSPWAAKGTEFDPTKMGGVKSDEPSRRTMEFRKLLDQTLHTLERASGFSPDNLARQMIWNLIDQVSRYQMRQARTAAAGTNKVDYLKLAEAIAASLDLLARVAPKGSHIQSFAADGTVDLRDWISQDRRSVRMTASAHRGFRRIATTYTCSDCGHNQASNVVCEKCGNACSFKKEAEIKLHETPKILPPRNDMRSHLDEDVKKEMEEDRED
jgi:ribosomal protein L32